MDYPPLFSEDYLFSHWEDDFTAYCDSGADTDLRLRLQHWANRETALTETQLEAQFTELFFKRIWGYWGTGERDAGEGFCFNSQYGVDGAGQTGGRGAADLALGWWGLGDLQSVAQVLAEFKDIRSCLDAPQSRKGNSRSPVKQCLDYLKYEFDKIGIQSPISPTWGIITNMNEFRLYCRKMGDESCQRFVITSSDSRDPALLGDDEEAVRRRFLFQKLFRPEQLLARHGKSRLALLLDGQVVQQREFEKEFYREYSEYRKFVFNALVDANPQFSGTRGKLVKLAQRFLDRCIFIFFCEDMGKALSFPPGLLRDILIYKSCAPNYSGNFGDIWALVKELFKSMRDGGPFPPDHHINRFNGGLFEEFPELDNLTIPNRVFCAMNQGASPDAIDMHKQTLLYLSARYNYGVHGTARKRTITLYTLGRIFEQSITELEFMEAEAEGRQSLAALSNRKRDGVYYTPEWVTGYIVRETLGIKLAEIRAELDLELGVELPPKEVAAFRKHAFSSSGSQTKASRNPPAAAKNMYKRLDLLDAYENSMKELKILDPACGSGAFLIQALRFLLLERQAIADERERIRGLGNLFDINNAVRSILSDNLYGVDINPEAVEITQLALWLHTAQPGKPLSNLDHHIRCGNSLVSQEFEKFYETKYPQTLFHDLDEQERENINIFDWSRAFPEVFGDAIPVKKRGFDCIIGNPPYVKLQHFRTLKPDESDFYIECRNEDHEFLYESAQTGNFDLYLLFIEKGVSLLNKDGLMGFIAPSLWLKNEYGQGLRNKIKETRALDRWIDFKSFQVFEEATTYTALQFFSRRMNESIHFFSVPDGDIAPVDWNRKPEAIGYSELPDAAAWNLVGRQERELIARLQEECDTLEQASSAITVGIQTSADLIYHLHRLKPGKYTQIGGRSDGQDYEIEDAIMHPLVSGNNAKRYQSPAIDTYLLFPYVADKRGMRLFTDTEMKTQFPKAWNYLVKFEQTLRSRERNAFNDDNWFRFGRNQNIDKQDLPKLGVGQTVPEMRVFADANGEFYFNNVRVNGILPKQNSDLWFLLGVLNSPVVDYVFKRTAKPKDNDYYEANKQYIAPLPIPRVPNAQKKTVGQLAKKLQKLHTEYRDKVASFQCRLNSSQCVDDRRKYEWLWAEVKTIESWKATAPENLEPREKTAWAKREYETRLSDQLQAVAAVLFTGAPLSVSESDGEIQFLADSMPIVSVYIDEQELPLIVAQWRQIARTTNITESFKAKKLIDTLCSLRKTSQPALRKQIIQIDADTKALEQEINNTEDELNAIIYRLYKLSPEDIKLVEKK